MNIRVRTAEGTDGPIILAAFCPPCAQEAMPMGDGTCGFCGTKIITAQASPIDGRCGTESSYANRGCRCVPCRTAASEARRQRKKRVAA